MGEFAPVLQKFSLTRKTLVIICSGYTQTFMQKGHDGRDFNAQSGSPLFTWDEVKLVHALAAERGIPVREAFRIKMSPPEWDITLRHDFEKAVINSPDKWAHEYVAEVEAGVRKHQPDTDSQATPTRRRRARKQEPVEADAS